MELKAVLSASGEMTGAVGVAKGEDGKTPVKGVDYFTAAEIAEIINAALAKADTKYVAQLTGKGLSANDYTDTEKAEVAKIKGKVGFTDYATATTAGVVKVQKAFGLTMNPSFIQINPATNDEIRKKTGSYKPIVPSTLDVAVRSVNPPSNMSYNVSTCTALKNTINLWALTSSITSMNLTLPSGIVGDFIQVDFNTLDTAPAFTITVPSGIIADYDFSPEPNTIYSLFFDWGVIDISKGMNNLTFGWRFGYAEYKYTPTEG